MQHSGSGVRAVYLGLRVRGQRGGDRDRGANTQVRSFVLASAAGRLASLRSCVNGQARRLAGAVAVEDS
jgi:hypothetical protein